ncbi:hypothetical protein LXL04_028359 [Taraxacum kok-saghyz]
MDCKEKATVRRTFRYGYLRKKKMKMMKILNHCEPNLQTQHRNLHRNQNLRNNKSLDPLSTSLGRGMARFCSAGGGVGGGMTSTCGGFLGVPGCISHLKGTPSLVVF